MGLFDEITCDYPLPDLGEDEAYIQSLTFQTKSFDPSMDHYTITKEGRLILHQTKLEMVPEEERPYYGTEDWDKSPMLQMAGMLKSIDIGDVDMKYHGDMNFYVFGGNNVWIEFWARFTEGTVTRIQRLIRENTNNESESDQQ